jgi:galactonate dehydratase
MRLTGLEFFAVAPPPPGWGGRHWQIVRLTTDDGITGLGEVYASAVGVTAMRAVIEDVSSPATWRARAPRISS